MIKISKPEYRVRREALVKYWSESICGRNPNWEEEDYTTKNQLRFLIDKFFGDIPDEE